MTTHFLGKYEIELKFKIKDISEFRDTLLSLHPEAFVFENNEYDIYYDDPLASLQKRNMSMVLRSMSPSGIKLWIVKGPEERRCEAVNIESVEKADSMLHTLGYIPIHHVNKTRSIYFLDQFHITLDYIAMLGHYVEISVMTDDEAALQDLEEACVQCALRLGLDMENKEPRSYRQLLGF